jgi:hypothetical protein
MNNSEKSLVNIVQAYYDAVDSHDSERLTNLYLPAPSTTLQFNADPAVIGIDAIRQYSVQFFNAVSKIKHTMIDVWTTPLMGNVVPVDLPAGRSISTVTVVSTALPTFTVKTRAGVIDISLPATSIFTIDKETEKFVSVHNMFDLTKVFSALQS